MKMSRFLESVLPGSVQIDKQRILWQTAADIWHIFDNLIHWYNTVTLPVTSNHAHGPGLWFVNCTLLLLCVNDPAHSKHHRAPCSRTIPATGDVISFSPDDVAELTTASVTKQTARFYTGIVLKPHKPKQSSRLLYHLIKAGISCLPLGLIKQTLSCVDGSFIPFGAKPPKRSAWRLNTWLCVLRGTSFVVAASISSAFKWHQTGGTLSQAYKWLSVQVLHLTDRQSQNADRPSSDFSKWFITCFYSPFRKLASLFH